MNDALETPFASMVRRAGLTTSMASRIVGLNKRTGRRLTSGEMPSVELTPENIAALAPLANNPAALARLEASAKALALLWPLVAENERALELEAQGKPADRPLRHQAIMRAMEHEAEVRARRVAEGKPPSERGSGPQRMVREAERALRRIQREKAVAEITGDEQAVRAREELETARAAKRQLLVLEAVKRAKT